MALGGQGERQTDLMIGWAELPRSPGHAFHDRLQAVLVEAGFDRFAEGECAPHYASRRGRPSLPPGRYFRMHLVGYFEGVDSERGLEWRCADSLSLREFLRLGTTEPVPDHSWLSKTRARLPLEVHEGSSPGCCSAWSSTGWSRATASAWTPRPWRPTPPCGRSCGATAAKATARGWGGAPRRAGSRRPRPRT